MTRWLMAALVVWPYASIAAADVGFDPVAFYRQLHQTPELSFQEARTAGFLAETLESFGFDVTREVGGHGVVALLENGSGPTVLLRMDMDALPVEEKTGLPWASTVRAVDPEGQEVPVMHACGHDVHMTVVTGVARDLAARRDDWKGTLLVIAQPAEERGAGARRMLEDGLYRRFPIPDFSLAVHTSATLPAGTVGYREGYAMANVDSVDILVRGVGGHGAYPHAAKDPVVLAAAIVMDLQTLVSREVHPASPAVVTVGAFHAGTKRNVIPEEALLQLTVRSYTEEVRQTLLEGIERIAVYQARALGFPEMLRPKVEIREEYTPALYNDPSLVERGLTALTRELGADRLVRVPAEMGGEDFARYGRTPEEVPVFMMRLGTVPPLSWAAAEKGELTLPSLHSPRFAPDPEPTLTTGLRALSAVALELFDTPVDMTAPPR